MRMQARTAQGGDLCSTGARAVRVQRQCGWVLFLAFVQDAWGLPSLDNGW